MSEPPKAQIAQSQGAPSAGSVPRMENVRLTAPDLERRRALELTRGRLVLTAAGFALLFTAAAGQLAWTTVLSPTLPKLEMQARRPDPPVPAPAAAPAGPSGPLVEAAAQPVIPTPPAPPREPAVRGLRASITDRSGATLAISRPRAALIAIPVIILDPDDAARRIHQVLPRLPEAELKARLSSGRKYVYLARQITPAEQLAVNALGIPGIEFERAERRDYPMGRVAAHVIGRVNPDGDGIFGIEAFMNARLRDNAEPLRLSLDLPIQAVLREELSRAMTTFNGIGGAGIVMDVRSGEIIAMVSLPDFDARVTTKLTRDEGLNRAVAGAYEPGSTFKIQTEAMAIEAGVGQLWNV